MSDEKHNLPYEQEFLDSWLNGQTGLILADKLDRNRSNPHEVAVFVSSIRRLRTLMGVYKQEFYNNPDQMKAIMRLIVLSFAQLVEVNIPGIPKADLAEEIQSIVKELDLKDSNRNELEFADLHESHLFQTSANETATFIMMAKAAVKNTISGRKGAYEQEYQQISNGGMMIWVLTQGVVFGFFKYVAITTRMLQEGKSLDEILDLTMNRIGFAGIGMLEEGNKDRAMTVNFVSSNILEQLKVTEGGSDILIPLLEMNVYDELISGGGTIQSIIEEILQFTQNNQLMQRIKIQEGIRVIWEYDFDTSVTPNQHVWTHGTTSKEIRVDVI